MTVRTFNPVLDLELRQRSRTMRSPVALALFLLLLVGVLAAVHSVVTSNATFSGDPLSALTVEAGRAMFEWVVAAELALLALIIPVISAGSIAGERARQTLVPLQVTMIRPSQIFLGKVLSSSAFVLLLMVASAPVLAVPFLVGGVTVGRVMLTLAMLLIVSVELSVIGVACSSFFRRTQTAILGALAVVGLLIIGPPVLVGVSWAIDASQGEEPEALSELLHLNPVNAVIDVAGDLYSTTPGPFTPLDRVIAQAEASEGVTFFPDGTAVNHAGEPFDPGDGIPRWAVTLAVQAVLTAGAAAVGIRRLRTPARELPVS